MADQHLQINSNGTIELKKTILWPKKKVEQELVIKSLFERNNWIINSIKNENGSFWKIIVSNLEETKKINLYISSIRDELRQNDEFKMQLGSYYPTNSELGWDTIVLGIYVIEEGQYILAGYDTRGYDLSTNPSLRGTRTSGLQKALMWGLYKYDKCVMFKPDFLYYYINNIDSIFGKFSSEINNNSLKEDLQVIFYGAPGTGKSHKIKDDANVKSADEKNLVFRTTFHPDSDYSTFVGAYKPTTLDVEVTALIGKEAVPVKNADGTPKIEKRIIYEFVPQAFLQAYVAAWNNPDENVYLVIEEINRGNCAQIFGDLFQLLDRKEGVSEYPIMADRDLAKYLLNEKDEKGKDVLTNKEGIKDGKLKLPKNLYIWATMNTSDQSLFPIDSAFKRRWDWVYIPIKDHEEKDFKIDINGTIYSWWGFLEKINNVIGQVTSSEDKKLGYFFVKANGKDIDATKFVGKVLFYLWNDVFKNYGFENAIFSKGENKIFTFSDFFDKNGDPNTKEVNDFLKKLDETIDKDNSFIIQKSNDTVSSEEESSDTEIEQQEG